jgi:hypothetical protein
MAARARSIGMILLAVFLIVHGLILLIPGLNIPSGIILGVLALAAGVLLLLGR